MKRLALAATCVALLTAPAWGAWSEDFQGYTLGSGIIGQGGWTGFDGAVAPDSLVAADPDAGAPSGSQVLQQAAGSSVVQTFAGYTSGAWVFTGRQYIPSSRQGSGPLSFILLNNYVVNGSKGYGLTLTFDLVNNVVNDIESRDVGVAVVYDAWVDIRVDIDLTANVRTVFYNGASISSGEWYNTGNADHTNAVAALALQADVGGDPVYYDDLALAAGSGVQGIDLTTNGSVVSRYLVNLGQGFGDTSIVGSPTPTGLYEFVSSGGNQQAWWQLNDGNHDNHAQYMVTYLGAPPDFVGYKFKMPATVEYVVWWNDPWWGDGGTFAAAPAVEYLDAVNGTWHVHTDVTWNRTYNNLYVGDTDPNSRAYIIKLNNPPANVWGVRLIGDTQPGVDDLTFDGNLLGTPGTGFIAGPELTLYGSFDVAPLDLSTNLALAANGGAPISNHWHAGTFPDLPEVARVNDGLFNASNDTWGVRDPEDYIGITWPTPQNNVAAVGMVFAGFKDGGYFADFGWPACPDNTTTGTLRVEYTTDGTNWTPVTGLDLGRYPQDAAALQLLRWGPDTAFLFRFDPVSGITGIRLIGPPAGYAAADNNGFVGVLEFEVFANSAPSMATAPQSASPSLVSSEGIHPKDVQNSRTVSN